ncbi:MAG: hypothetical protein N3E36_05325 [Sulfolobales archaeon]|nr:hypothetical protein [Sulfolobales archaeon]MCX8199430.1 hypothetical protein [Sulfolobales archaeon]MDW8170255.1 hypothetical protein [Desulfurococcaceae archaeon]
MNASSREAKLTEVSPRIYEEAIESYKKELYSYNNVIRHYGYYLKPMHVVFKRTKSGLIKYIYYGRYWYRVKYLGKRKGTSRVKWVYIGRNKPDPSLPDPPTHPLNGLVIRVVNEPTQDL